MVRQTGNKVYFWLISALMLCAFILGYFSFAFFNKKEVKEKQNLPPIPTIALNAQKINPEDVLYEKTYIGYVTPIEEALIQPFISGFIEKVLISGGQEVKKGDLLVQLEQSEYEAALKAAYADVLKAEANYKNAEVYFERIQKAGNSVSKTEKDNAEASYLAMRASLEQAKANYRRAGVNYDYTLIKAPIDGVLGNVFLTEGNYVSPASGTLFSVVQYDPIRVVFSISDKEYLAELEKEKPFGGEKIKLELPNGKIFEHTGTFVFTDNALDKATNAMSVYADFKNDGKVLTPNTYVRVIVETTFKNAVLIPKNQLILENNGNFVYVIESQKLLKKEVEVLGATETHFIAKNTFENNDYLVEENVTSVDENALYEPLAEAEKLRESK